MTWKAHIPTLLGVQGAANLKIRKHGSNTDNQIGHWKLVSFYLNFVVEGLNLRWKGSEFWQMYGAATEKDLSPLASLGKTLYKDLQVLHEFKYKTAICAYLLLAQGGVLQLSGRPSWSLWKRMTIRNCFDGFEH